MSPRSVSSRRDFFLNGEELFLPQRCVIAMAKSANWIAAINRMLPMPDFRVRWVPWGQWDALEELVRLEEDALVVLEIPAAAGSAPVKGGASQARMAEAFAKGPVRCAANWLSQRRLRRQCLVAILSGEQSAACLSVHRHGLARLGFASFLSSFAELNRLSNIAHRHFQSLHRSSAQRENGAGLASVAGNSKTDGLTRDGSKVDLGSLQDTLENQVARNLPWE